MYPFLHLYMYPCIYTCTCIHTYKCTYIQLLQGPAERKSEEWKSKNLNIFQIGSVICLVEGVNLHLCVSSYSRVGGWVGEGDDPGWQTIWNTRWSGIKDGWCIRGGIHLEPQVRAWNMRWTGGGMYLWHFELWIFMFLSSRISNSLPFTHLVSSGIRTSSSRV